MMPRLCLTEMRLRRPAQKAAVPPPPGAGEHILEVDEAGWGRRGTVAAGLKAAVEGPHDQRSAPDHETDGAEVVLRRCRHWQSQISCALCACGGICTRDRGGGAHDAILL